MECVRVLKKYLWLKNGQIICPGKVKEQISEFFSFLFWFNSRISLTTVLTNMKLGREMKLCDPTNIGMFKSM